MVIVFYFTKPQSYTTDEIHSYESMADAIITKGIINLISTKNFEVAENTAIENLPILHYDKIEITQNKDNYLMLNIINDKKGDIQFLFDSTYSTPTIVSSGYWIQCFLEVFSLTPILGFPLFFLFILIAYELYKCKKENTPIF